MTTMIALVGAQPLPNFIPIRTEKPSAALFVYTDRTERVYKQLEVVLRQQVAQAIINKVRAAGREKNSRSKPWFQELLASSPESDNA